MRTEKIAYGGWQECYRLTDDRTEAIITAAVGPRIIHYGFVDGANLLHQVAENLGTTGGDEHRFYGGHRLWHAPEDPVRTYMPENDALTVSGAEGGSITVTAPVQPRTGIQKQMRISLDDAGALHVHHAMTNHNLWAITFAPWALSQMAAGGTAILPLPERASHDENLLPTSNLALWAYTDLSDPRWTFGREFVLLRQDAAHPAPQKIGANGVHWLGYVLEGDLLVKRVQPPATAHNLPDHFSNAELFADDAMLELETLGEMTTVAPDETVTHDETWHLFSNVQTPQTDADVHEHVMPHVNALLT